MNTSQRARQIGVIGCHVCGLVLGFSEEDRHPACPRCHSTLHPSGTRSLRQTWLFLVAALLIYIPANLLPVMRIQQLGQQDHSPTIIGGIRDLWHDGAYDLASVVFTASVALPCIKFLVLGGLLVSVHGGVRFARRQRAQLHRLLELIGYWSMLDVLVVSILGSLVRFEAMGAIEPDAGIYLFGISVILMIFAARSFDTRLIWDSQEHPDNPEG